MKNIPYSMVCEDIAHYHFMSEVLDILSPSHTFTLDKACYYRFKCSTKKQVINGYADIANKAFRQFPINLLLVIMDYDDAPINEYAEFYQKRREELFEGIKDRVVLGVPVRCIEHWLRYLQWKGANPKATKFEPMEQEDRGASKIKVFQSKRPSNEKTLEVIKSLVSASDIKWLCQRSQSFNHFHSNINEFIKA